MCLRALVISVLVIFSYSLLLSQSNEGTEFWFGFMEHRDPGNTKVIMITSRVNTSGTIRVPGREFSIPFTVNANDVTVFDNLPIFLETRGSEFINDNAIQIISDDPVSVYIHQFFGMRSEASLVLPKSSVGKEYYVMAYTGVPNGQFGNELYTSEFLIVANEDDTVIEFSLSSNSFGGKLEGSGHQIELDRGEVYQLKGQSWLDDLSGSHITANKPFSLFAGTNWSQVPTNCTFMDNLMEQMFPVSTWGRRYVGSPFSGSRANIYRVIAAEDLTNVRVEGSSVSEIVLNAGAYADFQSDDGVFIESDKAISVAQYLGGEACNGGVGDPSMVVLNTVEQIRDTVTLFNSRFQNIQSNFINIIAKSGEEDLIFFDNQNLVNAGTSFQSLGEEELFSYAIVPTSEGSHTIYTSGCGVIAMAYGYGPMESYAYSGGASFNKINENPIPDGSCLDEEIMFDTGLPPDRFDVQWDLGDGNMTQEHRFNYKYPSDDTASYNLSLIIEDLCFFEIDTLYKTLRVSLRQDLTAGDDQEGCVGTTVSLSAEDLSGSVFEWTGPNNYESLDQYPRIENISLDNAGTYQVVGNISGCRTFPEMVDLTVHENPEPEIGDDLVLCPIDGEQATLYPGEYVSYLWSEGSTSPSISTRDSGIYYVEVMDENGCVGMDSMTVFQQCPTRIYVPNVFSPNWDGINDEFIVSGIEIVTYDLKIYDRWGSLVFQSNDPSISWDGRSEFLDYQSGEYAYILKYEGFNDDAERISEVLYGTVLMVK